MIIVCRSFHSIISHFIAANSELCVSAATCWRYKVKHLFSRLPAVTEAIEIPQFIGRSYLTYDNRDILKRLRFFYLTTFFSLIVVSSSLKTSSRHDDSSHLQDIWFQDQSVHAFQEHGHRRPAALERRQPTEAQQWLHVSGAAGERTPLQVKPADSSCQPSLKIHNWPVLDNETVRRVLSRYETGVRLLAFLSCFFFLNIRLIFDANS